MTIDNKFSFKQKLAGLALAATAALSTLPGCSTTSAKAPSPTATATPSPTATPTTLAMPFCTQLNGGDQVTFDYTHQLGLYGTAQGPPESAAVTIDGSLVWIDEGTCEVINGYTICAPLVVYGGVGKGIADLCVSK